MSVNSLIKEILSSDFGSFGFVFGLMVFAGWIIYWVTRRVTTINSNHSVLGDNVKKIEGNIDLIREDLAYLKGSFDIVKSGDYDALIRRKSPVTLTDKGIEVAEELGANRIISKNWDQILKILEDEIYNKNAYDIQQYCLEKLSVEPKKFLDAQSIESLKKYAYNNGNPLQLYLRVIGLLVRDRYFKYKGMNLEEVDDHDPNS